MIKFLAGMLFFFYVGIGYTQVKIPVITGLAKDKYTGVPLEGVKVSIVGIDSLFKVTDSSGSFSIETPYPGFFSFKAEFKEYANYYSEEILITYDKSPYVVFELEAMVKEIEAAEITKSEVQQRRSENPVSTQKLSLREIERNPGGNRDISKIVTSLPGVISIPGFRNDIIIRGGAPSENKFYLDGIEIPVINHFQTQGATGGPVGILNVNFIKEATVYTAGFPVNLANGLSSVFDFQQIEGNKEKAHFRFTLGSSDLGLTADGAFGKDKKHQYIISARQSYLQGLFSLLQLPFLPNFVDYQAKIKFQIGKRDHLTFLAVGAIDFFRLNEKVNEGVTDSLKLKENAYILGNIPNFTQWNYTLGAIYKHYSKKSVQTIFLSRNYLNNRTKKYFQNDESIASNKILDYKSSEAENKLRFENASKINKLKFLSGAGLEFADYQVETYNKIVINSAPKEIDFKSSLGILKYNAFFQLSGNTVKSVPLNFVIGLRADGNNYNKLMTNIFNQITGNLGLSYSVNKKLFFNASAGQFNQLPAYTILGYRDSSNQLANKNTLRYISGKQAVLGMQWNLKNSTKITFEGFYKWYHHYPFSLNDSISLGNLGTDFAVVGNEPVSPSSNGRAYGLELLIQKRSKFGVYGILSYTLSWSKFSNKALQLIASAWDSRHTLSLTGGYKLKRNWEIGAKYRLVTGRPFTPFDLENSMKKENWDIRGMAILDYHRINSQRLTTFTQLDVRIDKVWYLKKYSLNLYLDIQNALNNIYKGPDNLSVWRDANGMPLEDVTNPGNYLPDFIPNNTGTLLPTLGIILDF